MYLSQWAHYGRSHVLGSVLISHGFGKSQKVRWTSECPTSLDCCRGCNVHVLVGCYVVLSVGIGRSGSCGGRVGGGELGDTLADMGGKVGWPVYCYIVCCRDDGGKLLHLLSAGSRR
jgi:hypothetical protein